MSSILKALKKLEDEKNAKLGQRVDITRDIFGAAQQSVTSPRWPLVAGGFAGAVLMGIMAFFYLDRPGTRGTAPPAPVGIDRSSATPSPAPSAEHRTAVPLPLQDTIPEPPKAALPGVMVATPTPPLTTHPKPSAADSKPHLPPATGLRRHVASQKGAMEIKIPTISANHPVITNPPPPPRRIKQNNALEPAIVSVPTGTPQIAVSGIAYNKDAVDRLAVINGVPAGEGKTVSGVTVEEIMPDKVRFSYGRKSFEVPVGRSNQ